METSTTNEPMQPRIYVACLAAYNSGYLHGAWIDASPDAWAIWDGINAMLKTSPVPDAEEFAIHDYEGFGGVRIEEYTGVNRIATIAGFLEAHGELAALVLAYYSGDIEEAQAAMEDRYLGSYGTLADYVQDVTEATTFIHDSLRYYIDWQAMARDAELNGDFFTIESDFQTVHVFAGC